MFEDVVASHLPMQRVYHFRYEGLSFDRFETPNLPLPCELHFALDCCPHDNLVAGLDTGGVLSVLQKLTTHTLPNG